MAGMIENELLDYLVTKGAITAKKTDGFEDMMPDTATGTVVCLKATGGIPSKGTPDPWIAIQALVRSDVSYYAARLLAAKVHTYFHEMIDATTTSYRILASKALAMPQSVGQDGRYRHLVSVNFLFNVVALDQDLDNDGGGDEGGGYGGKKDPLINYD